MAWLTICSSLSDDVFVVLCVDAEFSVRHPGDQIPCLYIQLLSCLLRLFRRTLNLDLIFGVEELHMNLSRITFLNFTM